MNEAHLREVLIKYHIDCIIQVISRQDIKEFDEPPFIDNQLAVLQNLPKILLFSQSLSASDAVILSSAIEAVENLLNSDES